MRLLLLALLLVLAAPSVLAQDGEARRVVLTDGTVLVGAVPDATADPLVVVQADGTEIRVPHARVREITPLYAGRFARLDPNRTRLFIVPTARTLGRGNGRLSTFVYLLPNVAYGVTDRIDVSGSALVGVDDDGGGALLNGNVKVQPFRTAGAAGALGATATVPVGSDGTDGLGGFLYGVATFGSETRAVTTGLVGLYGLDFDSGAGEVADLFAVLGAFETQLTDRTKFITENYLGIVAEEGEVGGLFTAGFRFFGDRFAVDLYGVLGVADGEVVGFAPIANFAYNF
ncbi:MAG: hypothetical protein R3362_00410 [Rhodothermales bacterium]|nr:hypothetical protein [Rhodothermales bacterium]